MASDAVTPIVPEAPTILLSLASRQVWPHILAVAHLKPARLILLHSDDTDESKRPAGRLQKFFKTRSGLLPQGGIRLEEIPHDDFAAAKRRLDELAAELNLPDCVLNFTGGNKLMATAAFQWATGKNIKSFYLERGNRLTWFEPSSNGLTTHSERLNESITNPLDPVALLRCQLVASEVEREGERLTLSSLGRDLSDGDFQEQVDNGPITTLVEKGGVGDRESKKGDRLELAAAALLLKLGVAEVRRSLRLKVNTPPGVSSRLPHAEIDLLFNWRGKLWLVDCKDRMSEEDLMVRLRRELRRWQISDHATQLLDRIGDELNISPTKVLKEDLIAINDIGGLLGQVICVRRNPLPEEADAYAKRNRIEVISKGEMFEGFRRLLYPERPASPNQIARLAAKYSI